MKKKIIIILLIILLCVAGALIYLFNFTDIFKSNEQLFWKYFSQNDEVSELISNDSIKKINQEKSSKSYVKSSKLEIKQDDDTYTINLNSNAINANNVYTDFEVIKNSNEVAKLKFVKKNNIVGIKMDELADGYIAVKSNRLKEVAQVVGVEDSSMVPENINTINAFDFFDVSKEDRDYIITKYGNIISDKTNSNNYKKIDESKIKINDKFYDVKGYQLTLSEKETKEILTSIFEELSKDSNALNIISSKLKIMNIPEKYSSVNNLSNKFSEISSEINRVSTSDDEYMRIIVYVNNNKLIQTNIEFANGEKVIVNYSKDNNNFKIYKKHDEQTVDEVLDVAQSKENQYKFINAISNNLYNIIDNIDEISVSVNVSEEYSEIISNLDILSRDNKQINYKSSTKITNDIEINDDFDNSKKIILNDLNQPKLKQIYQLLTNNIGEIYKEKIKSIKE